MELSRKPRIGLVTDTLVGAVVHVNKQRFPIGRKGAGIYSITMILACNVALRCAYLLYGLVMAAMTVFQFICLGASSTS